MKRRIIRHEGNKWQLWFAWYPVCIYDERNGGFHMHFFCWVKRRFVTRPHPLEKRIIGIAEYKA